jgi:hypothetical protein
MPNASNNEIPARLLRRPWYILLKHFKLNPDYFNEKNQVSISEYGAHIELIENPVFTDDLEKHWLDKGIGADAVKFEYDEPYMIKFGWTEKVCTPIGEKTKLYIRRGSDKKIRKGGQVQEILHHFLSVELAVPSDNKRKLVLSKAHVNALFRSARASLAFIYAGEPGRVEREHVILNFLRERISEYLNKSTISENLPGSGAPVVQRASTFWLKGIDSAFFETGNTWRCYERIGLDKEDWPQQGPMHGFMINALRFYKGDGGGAYGQMVNTSINAENERVTGFYSGPAVIDGSRTPYLHLQLHNSQLPFPVYFVLKVDNAAKQKIMIGHYTSFSEKLRKYITKMVVLEKVITPGQQPPGANLPADPADAWAKLQELTREITYKTNKNAFEKIPKPIRTFLASRRLNRLSMPAEPINFLAELKKWLDEKHKFIKETKLANLCKEYIVVYCFEDKPEGTRDDFNWNRLRLDTLRIEADESELKYNVQYVHRSGGTTSGYTGRAFIKTGNLELLVFQSNEEGLAAADRNYGLLNFTIPQPEHVDTVPYFTGILSGLGDKPVVPVSYRAMVFTRVKFLKITTAEIAPENINDECKQQIAGFLAEHEGNLFIKTIDKG